MGTKEKEESATKPIENESHGILFYIKKLIYKSYITSLKSILNKWLEIIIYDLGTEKSGKSGNKKPKTKADKRRRKFQKPEKEE